MKKPELQALLRTDLPKVGNQVQLSRVYPAIEDSAGDVVVATIVGLGADRYAFSLGERRGGFAVVDERISVAPENLPLFDTFVEEIRDMTLVEVVEA
jgi:hypothetical protein